MGDLRAADGTRHKVSQQRVFGDLALSGLGQALDRVRPAGIADSE
jgi:hypothetical protein